MRAPALLVSVVLAALSLVQLPAETARMSVDEVRPGMIGRGVTVFQGVERENFDAHILGVLKNVMGPKRTIIVARLTGGPLASTGVIQGMSGSPVYIDDRLIGAVSYSLGSFSKDAIAGITPIEEMVAADRAPVTVARRSPTGLQLPVTQQNLASVLRQKFGDIQPFAAQPADVQAMGLPMTEAGRLGTLLQPIATPLVLNGLTPELHQLWSSAFSMGGFVTAIGGSMTAEAQAELANEPLQPGDAVGAGLLQGDLTMAGTGTVTMVDEGRVYAFGHPFYNLGPAQFPMTRAEVTTLLPSLAISSRIMAIGDVLGTIDQDRSTGIFGSLGQAPDLIPIRVTLEDPARDIEQTFNFEVIDDPLFTPLLTYTTVLNTFFGWTRELGPRTFLLSGTARLRDHADVRFGDIYTGEGASVAAAASLARPLAALLGNEFEPVEIDAIEIAISSVEEPRTATLERVWLDASRPRAGDTVPLKVLSRNYRGAELLETVMIEIPAHASGRLTIQVSDATTLTRQEQTEGRTTSSADTLDQLIRTLNNSRRNNRLYVRLLRSDAGAVDRGEPMPALPGSVLAVLEGNRSSGGLRRLREATLGEWEIITDHAVSGSRRLVIDLR